jgi:formylmethanofuran dehydrogenase subunit C
VSGLVARLKTRLDQRADFSQVLTGSWATLSAAELAQRKVALETEGEVPLGDLFDLEGEPDGRIRFIGDLELAHGVGAGLTDGEVVVEGNVGAEAGLALAGGALDINGNAGPRPEAGAAMRRGLLVITGAAGSRTGLGMIAGTVVVLGRSGADTGLWSKRGSVVALGRITPPTTYIYACTYQPAHLRLLLTRLRDRYQLPIRRRHLTGFYRRYSGDMAELGKGEILEWIAK